MCTEVINNWKNKDKRTILEFFNIEIENNKRLLVSNSETFNQWKSGYLLAIDTIFKEKHDVHLQLETMLKNGLKY